MIRTLLVFVLLLTSCTFTYTNRREDKAAVQQKVTEFYDKLKDNQYEDAIFMFYKEESELEEQNKKLRYVLRYAKGKFGIIKGINLEQSTSKIIEGAKNSGELI